MSDDTLQPTFTFAVDPNSGKRLESWILGVQQGPTLQYQGREVELSEAYLKEIARNTRRAYAHFDEVAEGEPYRFPVKREHRSTGEREGDVIEVKYATKNGLTGLWFKVLWSEEMALAIESDRVRHVSPGLRPYTAQDGTEFGMLASELSITVDPFQKNLPEIQDTLDVRLSNYLAEGGDMPEELQSTLEAIQDGMETMMTRLNELKPDEPVEASQPDDEEPEINGEGGEEGDHVEPDLSDKTEVEASHVGQQDDGSEEPLSLSSIEELIERKIDEIIPEKRKHLNLSERGRQGLPTSPATDLESRYQKYRKQGLSPEEAAIKANQ
jgi:hypothetical protein